MVMLCALSALACCARACVAEGGAMMMSTTSSEDDEAAALDALLASSSGDDGSASDVDATLNALFAWSIENSDPETLRAMAKRAEGITMEALEGAGAGTKMTIDATARSKYTHEDLLKKRKEIREVLDAIAAQPSEAAMAKELAEIVVSAESSRERKVDALEALYDAGSQIDLANDFDKLGVLDALLSAIGGVDDDVVSAACRALASAASNNVAVQSAVYDKGGFDTLMALVSNAQMSVNVKHSAIMVLGMSVRTHEASRVKFFTHGGVGTLRDLTSLDIPAKTRLRALTLLADVLTIDGAGRTLVFPSNGGNDEAMRGLIHAIAEHGANAETPADVVSVGVDALAAALEADSSPVRAQLRQDEHFIVKMIQRIDGFIAEASNDDEWVAQLSATRSTATRLLLARASPDEL